MRHHPQHIAAFIDDASDVVDGPVRIGIGIHLTICRTVTEQHSTPVFQSLQLIIGEEIGALMVRDRNPHNLMRFILVGETSVGAFDTDRLFLADEAEAVILT
ncbi:hypothetical protein BMS3Bbin04_00859 [bacterium BMS3Bbin04]|nr:hypothetical protein BMS3Bbin04_00859 [bacterium BMS3Bbin04]